MTYKDHTYCPFWRLCSKGQTCELKLTKEVKAEAVKFYGKPFISYFSDRPDCFEESLSFYDEEGVFMDGILNEADKNWTWHDDKEDKNEVNHGNV
jgi:hypothetical protein